MPSGSGGGVAEWGLPAGALALRIGVDGGLCVAGAGCRRLLKAAAAALENLRDFANEALSFSAAGSFRCGGIGVLLAACINTHICVTARIAGIGGQTMDSRC